MCVCGLTDQGEQEAADGASSLAEGAVLLQQQGDELVGLGRPLGGRHAAGRARVLGTRGEVLQQAHLHLQDVLPGLLLQPLVQLVRVLLTESTGGSDKKASS